MPDGECQELKNIKYKTMLLTGDNNKLVTSVTSDISNLDLILDKESCLNKKEAWNKLDKSIKLEKMNNYIDTLKKKHKLSKEECNSVKIYLSNCLDKKKLNKNKDVIYIKESGIIENIPSLNFNNTTRKFLLKKQQHVSTAKCLGPKKKVKHKTSKKEGLL